MTRGPIDADRTLASGLGHPEGPDILPDGRIVMVETYTSKIVAWSAERGIHDYADCGGGPNACMLGSDGAVYITQNGGTVGAWRAEVMGRPSIQKAWPDGRVEEVVAEVDGIPLHGAQRPDLRTGWAAVLHRPGRLPAGRPQARPHLGRWSRTGRASCSRRSRAPTRTASSPSRMGRSSGSSRTSAASTASARARPSEQIARLPEGHVPDGLKVAANGDLWVTAFMGGGVDILTPDGTIVDFLETGGVAAQLRLPRGRR